MSKYDGPQFMTMFTIVGIRIIPGDMKYDDGPIYELRTTDEGTTIMCGRYADGRAAAQVCGKVGASPCQYYGPEAEAVTELAERWAAWAWEDEVIGPPESSP